MNSKDERHNASPHKRYYMELSHVIKQHREYLQSFAKETSCGAYNHLYSHMLKRFPEKNLEDFTSQDLFDFLNWLTENRSQATKRMRFAQVKAMFNFAITSLSLNIKNPCTIPLLTNSFRAPKRSPKQLIDKEQMDTIIYRTDSLRDRLILELGSRCCMRIGEILKLKGKNVIGTRLTLDQPKSGKDIETVLMPERVAERLAQYIREKNIQSEERIFKISYSGARSMMNKISKQFGVKLRLHDLRRFGATYASRAGVPLEIISRDLLRHGDLKTSQIYIGASSQHQTQRWLDTIYER
ncbi:MAG: site-specific integrase [Deltaproteobacteria bacterium]|nr:site-specific integrase [Deltaproteobacteria bacterium]